MPADGRTFTRRELLRALPVGVACLALPVRRPERRARRVPAPAPRPKPRDFDMLERRAMAQAHWLRGLCGVCGSATAHDTQRLLQELQERHGIRIRVEESRDPAPFACLYRCPYSSDEVVCFLPTAWGAAARSEALAYHLGYEHCCRTLLSEREYPFPRYAGQGDTAFGVVLRGWHDARERAARAFAAVWLEGGAPC